MPDTQFTHYFLFSTATISENTISYQFTNSGALNGSIKDPNDDGEIDAGETWLSSNFVFSGKYYEAGNGDTYAIYESTDGHAYIPYNEADYDLASELDGTTSIPVSSQETNFVPTGNAICFAAGTGIATPEGDHAVETLGIGDEILSAAGGTIRVLWVGRQTVSSVTTQAQMVRIRAGALGGGLPHADLSVTADHGMVIAGHVITASALVNGGSIDWVSADDLPGSVTVYHVETEAHDVILANGAASETFVDAAGRAAFDNHAEYLALYGVERIVPEMRMPRIASARLLPTALRARLGLATAEFDAGLADVG